MTNKYFIVCIDKDYGVELANKLVKLDDSLSIAPMFITDKNYKKENENHLVYISPSVVNLSYKNNALLFVITENFISSGITIDDFYNNDICILTPREYTFISNKVLNHHNIHIIWVDSKLNDKKLSMIEMININNFEQCIEGMNYLYFIENENNIEQVILDYIYGDEETKQRILDENK